MLAILESVGGLLLAAALSGAVASTLANIFFTAYVTRKKEETESRHAWKEEAVQHLLGPMTIQLDRTKRAFGRWNEKKLYLELKVVREANLAVRDLLLGKPHLIPPDLRSDAGDLVQHYDVWLEEFEKLRGGDEPDLTSEFVYAGPAGYPFPKEAEKRLVERYEKLWSQLYGPA